MLGRKHQDKSFVAVALTVIFMGAAIFAAAAAGWFKSIDEAAGRWISISKNLMPDPDRHNAYVQWHRRYIQAVS